MPTYAYHCASCSYEEDVEQKITADPLTSCPKCGKESLMRGPGGGIGLVFKGSGFYCTDYAARPTQNHTQNPSAPNPNPSAQDQKEEGCQHTHCSCFSSKTSKPPS